MINIIIYETLNGRINQWMSIDETTLEKNLEYIDLELNSYIEVETLPYKDKLRNSYVNLNTLEVSPKPELEIEVNKLEILSDGIDESIISNIPNEISSIFIDDEEYNIDSDEVKFSSESPGIYKIKIDQFPYKPWETEIEVLE